MIESTLAAGAPRYELRFNGLFDRGHGFAFPCDAAGLVDIDTLSEHVRRNYSMPALSSDGSFPFRSSRWWLADSGIDWLQPAIRAGSGAR